MQYIVIEREQYSARIITIVILQRLKGTKRIELSMNEMKTGDVFVARYALVINWLVVKVISCFQHALYRQIRLVLVVKPEQFFDQQRINIDLMLEAYEFKVRKLEAFIAHIIISVQYTMEYGPNRFHSVKLGPVSLEMRPNYIKILIAY